MLLSRSRHGADEWQSQHIFFNGIAGVGLAHVLRATANYDRQLQLPIDSIGRDSRNLDRGAGVRERRGRRLPVPTLLAFASRVLLAPGRLLATDCRTTVPPGVGTPAVVPYRTTAPLSDSTSRGLPRSTSRAMEERNVGSSDELA